MSYTKTMKQLSKQARLDLRLAPVVKDLLQRAASAENKNVSDFVADHMFSVSKKVLLDQRIFAMNDQDWHQFNTALDREDNSNSSLEALFSRESITTSDLST